MDKNDTSITSLPGTQGSGFANSHALMSEWTQPGARFHRCLGIVLWSGLVGLVLALSN